MSVATVIFSPDDDAMRGKNYSSEFASTVFRTHLWHFRHFMMEFVFVRFIVNLAGQRRPHDCGELPGQLRAGLVAGDFQVDTARPGCDQAAQEYC